MDYSINSSDSTFGPGYQGPERGFDFTILFEDTILTILPASVFLLAAGARAVWLANKPNKVSNSSSRSAKLIFLSAFASVQLTVLLTRATNLEVSTKASVAAAALDFTATCALFVLSCFEHSRSVTPSTLIGLYLLVTLPFDVARLRTFLLIGDYASKAVGNQLSLSLALKLGVIGIEAVEKRDILLEPYRQLPPEATSGVYSRSVFWWLNPLLRLGFGRTLKTDDLFNLDDALTSSNIFTIFNRRWTNIKNHHRHSLLVMTLNALKSQLIISGLFRILCSAARFAQPFLILRTVSYVSNRQSQASSVGWGLTGGFFLAYFTSGIFNAAYQHFLARWSTQVRGGLITLLYQKTLDLSISSSDPTAALTLMSADVQQITNSSFLLHDTWCAIIDVVVAVYLLYINLGIACLAPAAVFVLLALATTWITKVIPRSQKRWLDSAQVRVSFTSSLLHSMRNVKLLGLASVIKNRTQRLRLEEINQCKRFRLLFNLVILIQNAPSSMMPFATFLVYFVQARMANKPLDLATSFSVLTILRILDTPLSLLLRSFPQLSACISCFQRIQAYLLSASRKDNRLWMPSYHSSEQFRSGNLHHGDSIELQTLNSACGSALEDFVSLKGCTFGWSSTASTAVRDLDLSVRAGAINMIVGPVGCGKSTLLKGILGETPVSQGFVYLRTGSVAFVDQDIWIQNGTVRDAIRGPSVWTNSPADERWYNEVISCCGLIEDLKTLSDGDMTKIGSRGISLSGGQKQRLALARAVYSRSDLLILDDVFSGLDNDTEELIFIKLLGHSGLLRRLKTTVLLVTHAIHRLPMADAIICLDSEGRISEYGTYTNLAASDGYVSSLLGEVRRQHRPAKEEPDNSIDDPSTRGTNSSVAITMHPEDQDLAQDLARRTGEWSTYKHWFKSAGYISTALSFLWGLIWMCSMQAPGVLVRYFAQASENASGSDGDATTFIVVFGATTGLSVLMIIILCWQVFLDMVPKSSGNLHLLLLETVLNAPLSFFTRTDVGSLTNRFSQDMALVDAELPFSYADTLLSAVSCIVSLGLLAISGAGYFAITIPVVLLTLYAIQKYYLRTSRQLRLLDLEEKAPLYTLFGETGSGLPTIRAFNWTSQFFDRNLELLDRSQRPFYLLQCIQRWLSIVLDLLVTVLVTLLMAIVVVLRDSIEPGLVGLGLLTIVGLSSSLTNLVASWTVLETSIGAVSRLRDFVRTTESEHLPAEVNEVRDSWPEEGAIKFANFSASYSEKSCLVLNDIDLFINPAEVIGICGRSGSGKSSTLASLFRLLDFRTGTLSIDGVDIATIPREVLRGKLNVIPQEPWWVVGTSVRFNLDPWHAESSLTPTESAKRDDKFINILTRCQLWSTIESKGGLDALMPMDFLSHGQRQLFCLARAMLRESKVVVLDEVSANVDVHTDDVMQRLIREEFVAKGCSVVTVAHRLGTIEDSHRVVVLSRGRIVEVGEPKTLLARKGSAFKALREGQ